MNKLIFGLFIALNLARAAEVKISQLPSFSSPTGGDYIPMVDSGTTKKITFVDFQAAVLMGLTTSTVAEGSNLYFTNARVNSILATKTADDFPNGATNKYYTAAAFNASFSGKSTSDLAEGSNLYYTPARFNSAFAGKNTDGLSEGSTNLYYTNARVNAVFGTKTTSDLPEGTNQYYTQARFDTAFAGKNSGNLAEGSNLYYSQTRFDNALAAKSTSNLSEGSNLYYTDTRARASISATSPITYSAGLIGCLTASTSVSGCLTAANWTTFNNKQPAGNYITDISGDVVATGPGSAVATIQPLVVTGAKIANSTIDLTTKVTGILPVANGGSGRSSLTANNVILGNGTAAVALVAPSTALNVLQDTGSGWVSAVPTANVTEVSASASTAAASATFVVIPSMTLTPPAGNYLVLFNASAAETNTGEGEIAIFVNNAQVMATTQSIQGCNSGLGVCNPKNGLNSMIKATVNGSQAIDVRYRNVSGTLTITSRVLELIKSN